jgi:signal peptidase II
MRSDSVLLITLSALSIFVLDLVAKSAIEHRGGAPTLRVGSLVRLRHVASRKRSYAHAPLRFLLVAVWASAFAATVLLTATGVLSSTIARLAIGAALGGAAGNLFDILKSRAVRDYIDLGWWPVFNLADVAILGGLAVAFLHR